MRFGPVPTQDAKGHVLAHSLSTPAGRLRKGRTLTDEDCRHLLDAGYEEVTVAQLEDTDVAEDKAAGALARVLTGQNLRTAEAFTGRANLYATADGVFTVDRGMINRINRIDEALTIATLSDHAVVRAGQMVATIKVIPFAAPAAALAEAVKAADADRIGVKPFRAGRPALVMTHLPGLKESVIDKTARVTRERLAGLGQDLERTETVSHDVDALANCLKVLAADGCDPILVIGASAIVDRRDVIPGAIEAAGGAIEHFGMPVDPGNLLALGRIDKSLVLGLPGCARSPQINGLDWVLARALADLPVTREVITGMGVGGLLKEIVSRPQPRDPRANKRSEECQVLMLAAGLSRRMGARNKLTQLLGDKPLIRHAVESAVAAAVGPVTVILGHEAQAVRDSLADLAVDSVVADDHEKGLAHSLRAGLENLPGDTGRLIIALGDMPRVAPTTLQALDEALAKAPEMLAAIPVHNGKAGNPVAFTARALPYLKALTGDEGARTLLKENADSVLQVPVNDPGILIDLDTAEAFQDLA